MKATALVRRDHEAMRSLLAHFQEPSRGHGKAPQFEQVHREILMHLEMEEELFYPEVQNAPAAEATVVGTAQEHHREIRRLLDEASQSAASKPFQPKVSALLHKIEEHFNFEEEILLEQARQSLSEYRLEELGLEMEDRQRLLRLAA